LSTYVNGKGAQALFLFFGVLVCAWASGTADAASWHWALALALFAVALYPPDKSVPTWEGAAVASFVAWAVLHTLFAARSYSPAGLFQPLFLATGFSLGRHAYVRDPEPTWGYAWAWAIVAIAAFALLESAYAGTAAAAPFVTPAVLAALINLALLPSLAQALWGPRSSTSRLVALTVLFAGLMAAASRGGWIGFSIGLAAMLLVMRGRLPPSRNLLAVAATMPCAAGLVAALRWGSTLLPGHGFPAGERTLGGLPGLFLTPSPLAIDSTVSRLELYALAAHRAVGELPFGSGYLSFAQVLEAGRASVPSYGTGNITYFVHNDYLQTLLELGLPGLFALVCVMALPFILLLRVRAKLPNEDLVLCSGLAGAVAAAAFQAGVDFPLYIPACLATLGFILGALAARTAASGSGILSLPVISQALSRILSSGRRVALAIGVVLLLVPLAAEWATAYAQGRWRQGLGQEAAYGFEIARRLQPRDWRYAWNAGKFWTSQAASTRSPEAATLADAAFAQGFAANRMEVKNLLGRIELQRALKRLMPGSAAAEDLEAWSAEALNLAPRNAQVRMERILVLEGAGRLAAAQREALQLAMDDPEDRAASFVAARLASRLK